MPLLGQLRQSAYVAPEHVSQLEWQAVQVAWLPTSSTKVELAHSAMHAPFERKGALVPLQVAVAMGYYRFVWQAAA